VIPSKSAGSNDSDSGWKHLAQSVRLLSLHNPQAARVKLQQMADLIVTFGRSTSDESSSSSVGTTDTRSNRDKSQQVESDVLIAAGAEAG
jgi:hypothetical protein